MNENKMGIMPVNKLLRTMAAPMVLSMLIGAFYNVVDSLFVSHYGENALSAVFLAFPIQNTLPNALKRNMDSLHLNLKISNKKKIQRKQIRNDLPKK